MTNVPTPESVASDRLKVVEIIPKFGPAGGGGAERLVVQLATDFARDRLDITVVSLYDRWGTELEQILDEAGVRTHYLGKRAGFSPGLVARLARLLRSERPHVIHTHLHALPYAFAAAWPTGSTRIVHTMHNLAEREAGIGGRAVRKIAFRSGVIPVAIASEVAESVRRIYRAGEPPVIPNGIPVDRYLRPCVHRNDWRSREGISRGDIVFVCIAGLREQKNLKLLITAFAATQSVVPGCTLLIVGEGDQRSALTEQISALQLQSRVQLLGQRNDIPDVLGAADAFVLSSDWEGNPLSVMEAMAAGKPVVSTAVGGVPELIQDGATGWLVPPRDAAALSDRLVQVASDADARSLIGDRARQYARTHFDSVQMAASYEAMFRHLTRAGPASPKLAL
jgi:glycosyltransferase involved in cell wall biosynthesis